RVDRVLFESASAARRVDAALAVVRAALDRRETVTVIAPTREAGRELVRRVASERGSAAAIEPTTLAELALRLARSSLLRRGESALEGAGLDAVVAHAIATAPTLGRYEAVRELPGTARAIASTLEELMLAEAHARVAPRTGPADTRRGRSRGFVTLRPPSRDQAARTSGGGRIRNATSEDPVGRTPPKRRTSPRIEGEMGIFELLGLVALVAVGVGVVALVFFPKQVDALSRRSLRAKHMRAWEAAARRLGLRRTAEELRGEVEGAAMRVSLVSESTWWRGFVHVAAPEGIALRRGKGRAGLLPYLEALAVLEGDLVRWCEVVTPNVERSLVSLCMGRDVTLAGGALSVSTTVSELDADALVALIRKTTELSRRLHDVPKDPADLVARVCQMPLETRSAMLAALWNAREELRAAILARAEGDPYDRLAVAIARRDSTLASALADTLPASWLVDAVDILRRRNPNAAYLAAGELDHLDRLVDDEAARGLSRHGRADGPPAREPLVVTLTHSAAILNESLETPRVRDAAKRALGALLAVPEG
ncbi:MAG: hypothetical protein ACK5U8_20370, partial [Deltaproteobacteria bacterium]